MTLLRLALATGIVLAPGAAVARAFGLRGAAPTLAWALAALFGALGVTFLFGASLTLTLVLLLAVGAAALPFARRAPVPERIRGRGWVFAGGVLFGLALWHVAGVRWVVPGKDAGSAHMRHMGTTENAAWSRPARVGGTELRCVRGSRKSHRSSSSGTRPEPSQAATSL